MKINPDDEQITMHIYKKGRVMIKGNLSPIAENFSKLRESGDVGGPSGHHRKIRESTPHSLAVLRDDSPSQSAASPKPRLATPRDPSSNKHHYHTYRKQPNTKPRNCPPHRLKWEIS